MYLKLIHNQLDLEVQKYTTKFGKPREIKNKNTFYIKSGKVFKEEKITFSKQLDTIYELRYKNSEFDARLSFIFDDEKNLIFRTFSNKVPLVGWQTVKSEYNEDGIREIIDFDSYNTISRSAIFTNDSLGNPILMELYDSNHNLLGYEKAMYDYLNNSYTYEVYDSNNNLKTSKQLAIDSKKWDSKKHNEHGDVILYPRNRNDNVYYLIEYKYDDLGNWIEQKIYTVEKKGNGNDLVNKEKDRRFRRKIKYW